MTYNELKTAITKLSPSQLNMDVTCYIEKDDEFFAISHIEIMTNNDILDDTHPFFVIPLENER